MPIKDQLDPIHRRARQPGVKNQPEMEKVVSIRQASNIQF
jgi:hypothetical protein